VPYLAPPAEHPGFDFPADRLNVGVVWSGGDKFARWRDKAIDMARFKRLFEVPGCAFHSLQVGPREKDLKVHRLGGRVQALGGGLKDFADTAAAIQGLDLVISVDTAVCHLAGALGRPVWTLLPHSADFRWLRQRQDSPWYPGMRLFRQPVPGDWDSVLEAVRAALAARVTAGD